MRCNLLSYTKYFPTVLRTENNNSKLEKETVDLLNVIGKKIEAAGKKYCEKHKIDLLLVQSTGSQFNYVNPTMDVTKEFVAFLNQEQETIEISDGDDANDDPVYVQASASNRNPTLHHAAAAYARCAGSY